MNPKERPLPVLPARLPVRITLAQLEAAGSGVLEVEGVTDCEPEKELVCVAVGVAEPEVQPGGHGVGGAFRRAAAD